MPRSLSPSPVGPGALPAQPFFASPSQRVRLARERFFDAGQRPTGLVPETVIQSWTRCLSARRSPGEAVAFDPISRARARSVLARSRGLLQAASGEIDRLEATLAGTGCRVLLTDGDGVIVHATPQPGARGGMLSVVGRIGVPLGELASGSNAPGIVVQTGRPCTVLGAEHFFERIALLHCAAAPIRDSRGGLVGVLDLTVEARPFAFDASALVGLYATAIENHLLLAGGAEQWVLQFQVAPALLGSPLEALAGITLDGRLAWCNSTAQQLLGVDPAHKPGWDEAGGATDDVEALFGASMATLSSRVAHAGPLRLRLASGLQVWMRVRAPDEGRPGPLGVTPSRPRHREATAPADPVTTDAPAVIGEASAVPLVEAATQTEADAEMGGARTTPCAVEGAACAAQTDAIGLGNQAVTLDIRTRELIEHTLAACGGNISRAARQLGVSRGLLYRRRRAATAALASSSAASGQAEGAAPATAPKRIPGAKA